MSHIQQGRGGTAAERVLGGSPTGVLVRLVVMSFLVGLILKIANIDVNDVMTWLDERVRWISGLGISSVEELGNVVVVGAVIVVPVWLLLRVVKILSR